MKEIKSNPSKILNCYIIPSKDEITVRSIAEEKIVKLTEIAIMDRHSNGSFIMKDRIINTYQNVNLVNKNNSEVIENTTEEVKPVIKESRELKSLKNIDEKMMTIDEYLDDIEK